MAAEQKQGVIVFFSYARRDKLLRDRLEEHLSNLKYKGLIQTWHDRDILAGSDWLKQIDISMHNAQIILLLISSTFMASDYCYGKEMQQALLLHAQKKATVIPILLRPVLYAGAPFARLSMLPTNGKPVTSWRDRDSAFVDVALSIENIATHYIQNRIVSQPTLSSQPQSLSGDSGRVRGAPFRETSCPFCSAETRPGDNFCLNCGNRLVPASSSLPPGQPAFGDVTLTAQDGWALSDQGPMPAAPSWGNASEPTVFNTDIEQATLRPESATAVGQSTIDQIEKPARLILRAENGSIVKEFPLEKLEMSIGRAPTSDILLSKDKLTSRRHATVRYESENYVLHDEHSANGTIVNGQQLGEMGTAVLKDGDRIGIGEHELVFRAFGSTASEVEDLPTIAVPYDAIANELTFRTRDDEMATETDNGADDEYGTRSMNGDETIPAESPVPESVGATPPEGMNSMGYGEETIGPSITGLPDKYAHLISEAIRRAYYTESVAAYERVLSHTPENNEALRGLGKALYGLARYDEALEAFRLALQSRETSAAYAGLGDVLVKRKRYSEAVATYEKACELDPDVTLDYSAFIHGLREVGRADEADQMYVRARDLGYFDDAREKI